MYFECVHQRFGVVVRSLQRYILVFWDKIASSWYMLIHKYLKRVIAAVTC